MKIRSAFVPAALLLLAAVYLLPAQESPDGDKAPLQTGPPAGTETTTVKAYAVVGERAGEEFDAAAVIGKGPGALLFIHELTRNALPVIRGVDQIGQEFGLLGFKSHTLMLSEDRTAMETKLKAVNGSLKLRSPVLLSLDGRDGPGNYALNRKAVLSLIMLKDGNVHKSVAFTDVNAEDANLVRELITEVAGELPRDPAKMRELAASSLPGDTDALRKLAIDQAIEIQRLHSEVVRLKNQQSRYGMQQQRGMQRGRMAPERSARGNERRENPKPEDNARRPNPNRQGRPPEDPQLNALLRSIIRQNADKETVDGIFAAIVARAAESEALHAETVEMFKLMLNFRDRYGSEHAQSLADSFLKKPAKTP